MTKDEISALNNEHEVCICMGVTLAEIVEAMKSGDETIEAIMDRTDAGSACELCQSLEMDEDSDREVHLDEILEHYTIQG